MRRFAVGALIAFGLVACGFVVARGAGVAAVLAALGVAFIGVREVRSSFADALRAGLEAKLDKVAFAPDATLVAVVSPDQMEHLAALIAKASVGARALVVLIIELQEGAEPELPRAAASVLDGQDARTRAALAEVARARVPLAFMTAKGRDAAAVTLEVARSVGARQVVAIAENSPAFRPSA